MKTLRITAVLLAAALLALLCAACGDTGNGDATTGTEAAATTVEDTSYLYDDNGYLKDELPVLNYNNRDFVIFTWSNQTQWEWTDTEQDGDVIKDALYKRQIRTEERLGIKIKIEKQTGDWTNRNTFVDAVYNNVFAGSGDVYDLVGQYTPAASIGAMRGCYTDLNDVDNLDLDKPWWPSDITESSMIDGKLYFTTGDITATLVRNIGAVLCNLKLAQQHDIEDVYALVDNKQWTMEKFLTITVGAIQGLNPDGSPCYSLTIANNVVYDNLFYGAGFRFVDTGTDGELKMSDNLSSERLVTWFDTCRKMLWENNDVALLAVNGTNGFTSGNVLFHFGQIADVQNYLREVDYDFAILPFPLYDDSQDDYCTIAGYWVTMYSIPVNVADEAMSGAVLECLGSYGYRYITPAVYSDAFQYRFLVTKDNARMFDLLHNTLVFDTGRTFADYVNCFAAFRQAANENGNWTTYYAGNGKVWEANLQNIINTLG